MSASRHHHITDQELLELYYRDGNKEWLGVLLPRYTLMLYGLCMKYLKDEALAKDMVQQVFLKVLNDLHKHKVTYFKSWLYTLTKNECLMELRAKGIVVRDIEENIRDESAQWDAFTAILEKEEKLTQVEIALEQLNHEQSLCIRMFFFEKKSYQQIADGTTFSVSQVKSHIQNGKRNLRIILERHFKNEE